MGGLVSPPRTLPLDLPPRRHPGSLPPGDHRVRRSPAQARASDGGGDPGVFQSFLPDRRLTGVTSLIRRMSGFANGPRIHQ